MERERVRVVGDQLTIAEVMEETDASEKQIQEWMRAGILFGLKVEGVMYLSPAALPIIRAIMSRRIERERQRQVHSMDIMV